MNVRHVLGISGGKDSAALAIYLKDNYPHLDIEYYFTDTGKELQETTDFIQKLKTYLGKGLQEFVAVKPLEETHFDNPFDHFLAEYGGYLPSNTARWCTKKLKLEPFEKFIDDQPTISYVGIRGDEDREGYISKKPNVQSIFPFRQNIWSEDVVKYVLANQKVLKEKYEEVADFDQFERIVNIVEAPITEDFTRKQKVKALLDFDVKLFNQVVFQLLKSTEYPVGQLEDFPLIENDEILKLPEIWKLLEDSGVGRPAYYEPLQYEVEIDGEIKKGTYSRSRSGCFFCFFQQKIEWVWLLETHPKLFSKAQEYEKDGYTWMDNETLGELAEPERVKAIKKEHYLRTQRNQNKRNANSWQEEILAAEGVGCASCFL